MTFSISKQDIIECKGWSYENIYFFIMILYMAMANSYTQVLCFPPSNGFWTFLIPIFLTIKLLYRNKQKVNVNAKLKKIIIVMLLWIISQALKYMHLYAMNMFIMYEILMAYIIVQVYGLKCIILYERFVTLLSLVSLPILLVYDMFPTVIAYIFKNFFAYNSELVGNAFIVGIGYSSDIIGYRNVGFAQEPGFFAVFLIVALYFNLLINNYNFRNKHFLILFISLITTQSTTGYISFLIIILQYTFNANLGKIPLILLCIFAIPSIVSLPFIGDKLISYQSNNESIDNVVWNANYMEQHVDGGVFVPQRFDGFALELRNFCYDPILGYGMKEQATSFVNTRLSKLILCSNGNIKIFSRFGIFLGIIFFFFLFKTGKMLDYRSPKKNSILFFLLFLCISFSYEVSTIPLLLSIWLYSLFTDKKELSKININGIRKIQKTVE